MEPATTGVWAEMLTGRKFLNEITSKAPLASTGWFGGGNNAEALCTGIPWFERYRMFCGNAAGE
jgi:hypothetical protein